MLKVGFLELSGTAGQCFLLGALILVFDALMFVVWKQLGQIDPEPFLRLFFNVPVPRMVWCVSG